MITKYYYSEAKEKVPDTIYLGMLLPFESTLQGKAP
jgi:hypothetical protein